MQARHDAVPYDCRVPGRCLIAVAVLALCLAVPSAAWGGAADEEGASGYFSLKASHGYRAIVVGTAEHDDGRGVVSVLMVASHPRRVAYYVTRGYVTDTRLKARFRGLGQIDLRLRRSGRKGRLHAPAPCNGTTESFDRATYRGRFRFRGEEGFAVARAHRIAVDPQPWVNLACSYHFEVETENLEPGAAGALLSSSVRRRRRMEIEFTVAKSRPAGRTLATARTAERKHGIAIERQVQFLADAPSFTYDTALSTAAVELPAPFAGSAAYDRGAARQWTGDLTVDLPGRSHVALARPGLRTTLVPAAWSVEPPEFR
jgi:hypothetical protein